MTKEQAIERLKNKLDNDKKYLEQCSPFSDLVNEVRLDNKSIEIILSMLEEKDEIIKNIIKRLDNDIKRITETKAEGCTDDYRRCRLKAYRTKTKEIKEYIEEQYFENKAKEVE